VRKTILLLVILIGCTSKPDQHNQTAEPAGKPKLVVGIVVDQMRHEYLYRYYEKFGDDGFKRIMKEGFVNKNTHYNYIPTKTAPGHASVYSGTTPAVHGIIGNSWYDRRLKRDIENVEDTVLKCLSPRNMLSTTITDELKLATQGRSKVIGVSIKDRGAILPAGHNPDGAFWYEEETGNFTSSKYYNNPSPEWLKKFNDKHHADSMLNLTWNTLRPIEEYTESGPDDTNYEEIFEGKERPVFPYNLAELRTKNDNFELLPNTPFGNTITTQLAFAAVDGEKMGEDDVTDFLAISYSSTDKIGHGFGPRSVEVEDVYLRLDQELATLMKFLDEKVGKGEYLLFLTADHAVAEVPRFMNDQKMPAGLFPEDGLLEKINAHISALFGKGNWIESVGNEQVFLNQTLIKEKKQDLAKVQQQVADFLVQQEGIASAFPANLFKTNFFTGGTEALLYRGYNWKRSGDVLMVYEPGWLPHDPVGTSHGSGYVYDTHVPMLWYGWKVIPGSSLKPQSITDIAPTIAAKLNIKLPNAASGSIIQEVVQD
jgi:predicted AlkP superfamily pyrophosphatase or phosphodiesterase